MSVFSPPVGWPVQFYPNGDPKHPHAAVVTESGLNGQVRVNYQTSGGGDPRTSKGYVRHVDDPWVKENPDIVQLRLGCWGWVPGLVYQPEPVMRGGSRSGKTLEPAKG